MWCCGLDIRKRARAADVRPSRHGRESGALLWRLMSNEGKSGRTEIVVEGMVWCCGDDIRKRGRGG